ncbi:hypothetical protein [Halobacterium noricense]|uniref:hypothetical protein n=1 Tax=Halobacterium noricense TaxID=223182 RepID=UPI001E5ADCBC|nr:hypothetical protein [Halobacterium noricense]UHH25015.1 hypothetical protein LT974_13650 [Halobacterium noricense]
MVEKTGKQSTQFKRRTVLLGVGGLASGTGCLGVLENSPPDADGDDVPDSDDDYPNDSSRYRNRGSESSTFPVTKSDERQIEIAFTTGNTKARFSVEVVERSPVTIWMYNRRKFRSTTTRTAISRLRIGLRQRCTR